MKKYLFFLILISCFVQSKILSKILEFTEEGFNKIAKSFICESYPCSKKAPVVLLNYYGNFKLYASFGKCCLSPGAYYSFDNQTEANCIQNVCSNSGWKTKWYYKKKKCKSCIIL